MTTEELGPIPRFTTIGLQELANIRDALDRPLSGYLGGRLGKGYWCQRLEDKWCEAFGVRHAIACNSATSGLLAACMATKIGHGDEVWVPAYTMSATASCAKILGARIRVLDIETTRFAIDMGHFPLRNPKAIIVTNLFGHPAYLSAMRRWCDGNDVLMIEDNAQSPFAAEGGKYAGTVGHIGVFSLNVHKHINAGEGGIIVTNEADLAMRIRCAANHGELAPAQLIGLNLRMTEPTAAIACAQLDKAERIICGRIELADEINEMVADIPFIKTQSRAENCRHVYYHWVATIRNGTRRAFVNYLNSCGFPMIEGYSPPLNRVFQTGDYCPVAERMEDKELIKFEVCSHDPTKRQLHIMKDIVRRAADEILVLEKAG